MHRCDCGREFKIEQHYEMHILHCKGPKYCQNPECRKLLIKPSQKKFCSSSCASKINTKGRKHSIESKIKISKSLGGNGLIKINNCIHCNKPTNNLKYCSRECQEQHKKYHEREYIKRKLILWEDQNKNCGHCGYNLYDYINGPYEIHHIDNDKTNKTRENEILLCCNCHNMTEYHRFKGCKHTEETKKLIKINMKKGIKQTKLTNKICGSGEIGRRKGLRKI